MNNTTTALSSFEANVLATLKQQLPANVLWVICGFIGLCLNSLIPYVILRTKSLRNRGHYIILCHSIPAIFFDMATIVSFLRRCLLLAVGQPGILPQSVCTLVQLTMNLSLQAVDNWIVALGVDRMLAIYIPIKYKNWRTSRYLACFNTICYMIPLAFGATALLTNANPCGPVGVCVSVTAFSSAYLSMVDIGHDTLMALAALVYLLCLIKLIHGFFCKKFVNATQKREWGKQVQLKAFKSMGAIACSHALCQGVSVVINRMAFSGTIPVEVMQVLSPYMFLFLFFENVSHFFVYLSTNRGFRRGLLDMVRGKTSMTTVVSFTRTAA